MADEQMADEQMADEQMTAKQMANRKIAITYHLPRFQAFLNDSASPILAPKNSFS